MHGAELRYLNFSRLFDYHRTGRLCTYQNIAQVLLTEHSNANGQFIINTGAWLGARGTTVSGTVLSATEFCDFLCACYNVTPLNLQSHSDGCGTTFEVRHTLSRSKGGLAIVRHNEVRVELLYLARRAFTSAPVHAEPLIRQGRTRSEREIRQGSDKDKETARRRDDTRFMGSKG